MNTFLKDRVNDELTACLYLVVSRICDSANMTSEEIKSLPHLVSALQAQLKHDDFSDYIPRRLLELLPLEETAAPLTHIETCRLVKELMTREGVEASTIAPYAKILVEQEGPAIILTVID